MRQRQQAPRLRVLRPERDHFAEADDGFVRPLLAVQQDAEVGIRIRVLGADANGGPIGRFRVAQVALRPQEHPEIVVGIGMIRIEGNRAPAGGDRLIQPESIAQDDRQIAVPVRPLGLELDALLNQRDRLIAPALLMREHSRVVERVGKIGRFFEDPAVHVAGSHPLVVLLEPDGDRNRFVQVDRPVGCWRVLHTRLNAAAGRLEPLPTRIDRRNRHPSPPAARRSSARRPSSASGTRG